MYRLKISNARFSNDRLTQSFFQLGGIEGIASGMNSPPSDARPCKTASSKETCKIFNIAISLENCSAYAVTTPTRTQVLLRCGMLGHCSGRRPGVKDSVRAVKGGVECCVN